MCVVQQTLPTFSDIHIGGMSQGSSTTYRLPRVQENQVDASDCNDRCGFRYSSVPRYD